MAFQQCPQGINVMPKHMCGIWSKQNRRPFSIGCSNNKMSILPQMALYIFKKQSWIADVLNNITSNDNIELQIQINRFHISINNIIIFITKYRNTKLIFSCIYRIRKIYTNQCSRINLYFIPK